ncbi:MAG: 16S rRNA (cytosine(1402)-N(4))-methyltransferase RsmH [Candidatus Atribacteria bacterium]|nr:16S rRNA (cytosine(1402)-N(4))-methyltransferase RsmH [Candidatus Atribacteria bacterium]
MDSFHRPVMVREIMSFLVSDPDGVYVDATVGGGGHSQALLQRLSPVARVIGIDRDDDALRAAAETLNDFSRQIRLVKASFSQMKSILERENIMGISGALLDLGVSSWQLDQPERGFSFEKEGPLDMRMDTRGGLQAGNVVNSMPEKELADLIFRYGEERFSRRIAREVVEARRKKRIESTGELEALIWKAVPVRHGRIHPATRTFMALRIYVNRELEELQEGLQSVVPLLRKGGRVVVLSYHSLEDRIVKNFFRSSAQLEVLTKKPVVPSPEEVAVNPRARSARLRVAERIVGEEGETA